MKLESLSIRDFRCIESLDLSFKDELDLIRDCVPEETGVNGDDSGNPTALRRFDQVGYSGTSDPRLILTSLAMRAQVAQNPKATVREDFVWLKQLYERGCHPHTIGELYNTEHGLDLEFRSDRGRYDYDGLSGCLGRSL